MQIPPDDPHVSITGALGFDRTALGITPRRLPDWTRAQVPAFMEFMVVQPSGVRLEFVTTATEVALDVLVTRIEMASREPSPAHFDLIVDGGRVASQAVTDGQRLQLDLRRPGKPNLVPGGPSRVRFQDLPAGVKHCELWLPTNAIVELRGLQLNDGAQLLPLPPKKAPLWVHYGSSISHCAQATSPTRTWPAVAARQAGVALHSLGFGGNCQLDQFVARTIRDLPADLISIKAGINVVNMDSMRERTFAPAMHGFVDTVREKHPDTPLLIISPIYCPSAETTPGPTLPDASGRFVTFSGNEQLRAGCLTLTWIRKILQKLVAARQQAGDDQLFYLDGLELFSEADAGDLPDDLHPNGPGYERMGERFYQQVFANDAFAAGAFHALSRAREASAQA